MKFILFVEGHTEDKALQDFLGRWLQDRLQTRVGIKTVRFEGWPEMVRGLARKARQFLDDPSSSDIIAVIALLDLYGPTFFPADKQTAQARYAWAKGYLEQQVGRPKFHQHFAVHETEAWLLSDLTIFPTEIRKSLEGKYPSPETVNSDEPPAKVLEKLYLSKTGKRYKKVTKGENLFGKLDPAIAYQKCPSLKALLDEMLSLARQAGLS